MNTSQRQSEAITHRQGPCMVLAGPGSGKTFTIIRRIEYLIEECGVPPEKILVITFTRYAAREMQNRFQGTLNRQSIPVQFGTFHSVYFQILKWAYGFDKSSLLSQRDKRRILLQVLKREDMRSVEEAEDLESLMTQYLDEIGKVKNQMENIAVYESVILDAQVFRRVYNGYEAYKKQQKKIDFDDMLQLCLELLQERPDILAKWQDRFSYILVDEFQDINMVQYKVLALLAAPENNLFVVGDDDQAIYRFRGACPEIMLHFPKDYPEVRQIQLDCNFRSTGHIVKGACRVIRHNKSRYEKSVQSVRDSGNCVHVQEVRDVQDEYKYLCQEIHQLKGNEVPYSEIAVLFRTNVQAALLTDVFVKEGIPFQISQKPASIYTHFISRDVMAYMRLAAGIGEPKDFLLIMNKPLRYLSRESVPVDPFSFAEIAHFYCDKEWMQQRVYLMEKDLARMKEMTPYAALRYLRRKVGYEDYVLSYGKEHQIAGDVLMGVLDTLQDQSRRYGDILQWLDGIREIESCIEEKKREVDTGVVLLTMHGAKGLEFDTVFIVDAIEGVIPYRKAVLKEEMEEERRLFYVAMTRAKNRLCIIYEKKRNGKDTIPSRFVNELMIFKK